MRKEPEKIYVEVGFENLMRNIYGSAGHCSSAGHTRITSFKKQLLQLFRTLKTAIRKNVTGDDRYKESLMVRCDVAIAAVRSAAFRDEIVCDALQFTFELLFKLLGRIPDNRQSERAHHSHKTDLSAHRTFNYARTSQQRAKEITDAAFHNRLEEHNPSFETLITALRKQFHDDADKFLSWLRSEHKSLYDRFH